ncbi:SagB/ThcOx family dehydrogenase [Clostridium disporicum]|uniref:Nitroreductase family protein n=1 Tax=Clostridium disporicum TaxID=84024 RepID=A0A174EVN1_9CLOT|nr:SagB/ThcOx family dehydrogenase [Clostridium disporicum]CUO40606.1 nitroreductase family protein [Clostridium disporicum]
MNKYTGIVEPIQINSRLALDYHENSKKFFEYSDIYNYDDVEKYYPNTKKIKLVRNNNIRNSEFFKIITQRRSHREYSNEPINFEQLSEILYLSYGCKFIENEKYRNSPSAGFKYPLEIYIFSNNCNGLKKGIYHFNPINSELELLNDNYNYNCLSKLCNNQTFINESAITIFITSIFEKTMSRYGDRGYRYILLDAGHVMQNIYLTATYFNLGITSIGGFYDNEINELLGIDGINESTLYIASIGNKF